MHYVENQNLKNIEKNNQKQLPTVGLGIKKINKIGKNPVYDITVAGLSRLDQVYDIPRIRDRQLIGLEGFTQAFAYITNKTGIEEAKHWNIQLKTFKIGTWTLPKHITV